MNHRYRLASEMAPGFNLHTHAEEGIADAIKLTGQPFFIGLQGYPEMGRDPALNRLWSAFLNAAEAYSLTPANFAR